MRYVILLTALLCACVSTENMTDEERREVHLTYLAEARVSVEESRVIADAYVEAGRIDEAEVVLVYAALEAALPAFEAAINKGDRVAQAEVRARLVASLAKLAILVAAREDEPHRPGE